MKRIKLNRLGDSSKFMCGCVLEVTQIYALLMMKIDKFWVYRRNIRRPVMVNDSFKWKCFVASKYFRVYFVLTSSYPDPILSDQMTPASCYNFFSFFISPSVTEYNKMPPLYELEDFDRCMQEKVPKVQKNIYCYTRTQIKPNDTSDLWQYIQVIIITVTSQYHSDWVLHK